MQSALSLKLYLVVSGSFFFLVGILHLFRLIADWPVVVGTHEVPYVVSIIGLAVATAFAIWAVSLLRRT